MVLKQEYVHCLGPVLYSEWHSGFQCGLVFIEWGLHSQKNPAQIFEILKNSERMVILYSTSEYAQGNLSVRNPIHIVALSADWLLFGTTSTTTC
jgi:hypothetical protein